MTRCLSGGCRVNHRTPRLNRIQLAVRVLVLFVLAGGIQLRFAHAQSSLPAGGSPADLNNPCTDPATHAAVKDAFRLLCSKEPVIAVNQPAIVIGFLGGFVKRDDVKHPEVAFAAYLRHRYGPAVNVEVFGNHDAKQALDFILENVSPAKNSSPAPGKQSPKIILYGHSWGASQVVEFARELERHGIPVALTIQVDSVRKTGQNDRTVPANVAKAVNFYQRKGLTPGRPLIVPEDAERTKILGNFHMTYKDPEIRIDNYRWISRIFNKPHHLIENDPRVWDQIVSLIDAELTSQPDVSSHVKGH